jgi:hypothetical protein
MIGDDIEVTVLSIIGEKVSRFGLGCTAGATQRNSPRWDGTSGGARGDLGPLP